MCTDAVQPISNGLYARRGMVPRIPIWRLFGEVRRWSAVPPLPGGLTAVPFEAVARDGPDGPRRLAALLDEVDRGLLASAHPVDHAYLRRDGRVGFLSAGADGRVAGYAYGSAGRPPGSGRGARPGAPAGADRRWRSARPRARGGGPVGPGHRAEAMRGLLDAGLRIDGFPGMICWSRADHPFDRYLPISLAIV